MKPIALVIDEVAEVDDQTLLVKQVKVNRAAGVFPIFATNDPTKSAVVAKSNLSTRISFSVISSSDSIMGFGRPGANKLPKVQGRGLIVSNGRVTEFQSFVVEYAKPTEEGLLWLADQMRAGNDAPDSVPTAKDEIIAMAEKIRSQWSIGLSKTKVSGLLVEGKPYAGSSWCPKVDAVIAYLVSTTPTTSPNSPFSADFGAVAA